METEICEERHKNISETLTRHEKRMNNHSERLDKIEQINSRLDERLTGLIKQLEKLNRWLAWVVTLVAGAAVSFILYVLQNVFQNIVF